MGANKARLSYHKYEPSSSASTEIPPPKSGTTTKFLLTDTDAVLMASSILEMTFLSQINSPFSSSKNFKVPSIKVINTPLSLEVVEQDVLQNLQESSNRKKTRLRWS